MAIEWSKNNAKALGGLNAVDAAGSGTSTDHFKAAALLLEGRVTL
jgi:hypothetical protein